MSWAKQLQYIIITYTCNVLITHVMPVKNGIKLCWIAPNYISTYNITKVGRQCTFSITRSPQIYWHIRSTMSNLSYVLPSLQPIQTHLNNDKCPTTHSWKFDPILLLCICHSHMYKHGDQQSRMRGNCHIKMAHILRFKLYVFLGRRE